MKMLIFRFLAVLLRIYLHTSALGVKIGKMFLFNNINTSIGSIRESTFLYKHFPETFNTDTSFIVKIDLNIDSTYK
jgi:hypothetical protein